MFDFGCVKQSVVDRRADPRIGRGVESLFVGECRGLPVTQPLGLRYALPQHDGREFAQALLPDAPLGGYRLQVDEPCVAEMAYLAQRAQVARHVGADFENPPVFEQLQDGLGQRNLVEPEQVADCRRGELQQRYAERDARAERGGASRCRSR